MGVPAGPRAPQQPGIRVVQWAQHPGPVGGVTASVERLTEALAAAGHDVRYVDTGSPARAVRALPHAWRRRSLHLFHITRMWRAIVLSPVFAILPGRTVLVLHSGAVRRQLEAQRPLRAWLQRLSLRAYDQIWAVSADISAALPDHLLDRVQVVSPFAPVAPAVESRLDPGVDPAMRQQPTPPAATMAPREPHLITVATNSGLPHYNAGLAVDAVRLVRRDWPDARLWILAYDQDGPDLARLRESVSDLSWVELSLNLSGPQVTAALARSGVFLRPTDWDGDSVIVREALAVGTRVVATEVSARPAGVELCGLSDHELAAAVLVSGRVSDGAGLASVTMVDAARAALEALRR